MLFIVGLAAAEATGILGLFVFPAQRQALFVCAVFGVLQFLPIFVNRFPDDRNGPN